MSPIQALVNLALENSGEAVRYRERLMANPVLAELGQLPRTLAEISSQESPWFCHGLAFRFATYSDTSDYLFNQWESLLKFAQQGQGWQKEYDHWNKADDHWAKKWDRFHHFLWLLQCYEYFSSQGIVSFPASNSAMPDLLVKPPTKEAFYVECSFYSKWWPGQEHFEAILNSIDLNLTIKRRYNIKHDAASNPFRAGSDAKLAVLRNHLATQLAPDRLAELRVAAQQTTPQTICDFGDFEILLEGKGEYKPGPNAHGDAAKSLPVYVEEIITAKKNKNNLQGSRPNVLLVNSLGVDFQLSLAQGSLIAELPYSIDEIWISSCGIDEKLENCQRVQKIIS